MKLLFVILLPFLALSVSAQKTETILATANNQNFTAADLTPEARQEYDNLPKLLAETRAALLEQQINEMLFEAEATAQKTTVEKLIEREIKSKIAAPTDVQIKAVYDANQNVIGGRTLEEVRPQIIAFLKREPEQQAFASYLSNLKTKHKATLDKDVNAAKLTGFEVLATIGDKQITTRAFETKNKTTLAELEADVYEHARESLEQTIYYNLVNVEAQAQGIDAGDLIAKEVTSKLKNGSSDDIPALEAAFRRKLFQKYNAKFLIEEIAPIVQNIAIEADDPAQGKVNAPVTIVMFTDFQCPACAATHPVVKNVLADYGDKVRFVVRDFPLVTIHENAFPAAVAAGAAGAQGKFFEYGEVLYQNQNNLDAASLLKYAADLKLNVKQFEADLTNPKIVDEVRRDAEDGKRYGINSTPTIFVNGVNVRHFSPESFRRAIDKALKK